MKLTSYLKYIILAGVIVSPIKVSAQTTVAACAKAYTCQELGFTMTAANCSGMDALICPFDGSKYFCNKGIPGEIRLYAGRSIPSGWIALSGSSMSSLTYPKLYNAIGTTYGGNSSTFNIPNVSRKFIIGAGSRFGLNQTGGEENHYLTESEMPSHNHGYDGGAGTGKPNGSNDDRPTGDRWSYPRQSQRSYQGGSGSHNNMPPYLTIYYIMYTGA